MSSNITGDFVKSLKEKITEKKNRNQLKRNLLQDSLNILIENFKSNSDLEIRTIRNFEINEVACYVDIYSPSDFYETVTSALEKAKIPNTRSILADYKCVFIIDLEDKLIASGNPHNIFSIEVFSKRLKTYKIKISPCDPKFSYSVFDKGYHEIKYWMCENMEIYINSLNLREADRSKKKVKISTSDLKYEAVVNFNDLGELETFNLFHKKGRKTTN